MTGERRVADAALDKISYHILTALTCLGTKPIMVRAYCRRVLRVNRVSRDSHQAHLPAKVHVSHRTVRLQSCEEQ